MKVKISKTWITLDNETCFAEAFRRPIIEKLARESGLRELSVVSSPRDAIRVARDSGKLLVRGTVFICTLYFRMNFNFKQFNIFTCLLKLG